VNTAPLTLGRTLRRRSTRRRRARRLAGAALAGAAITAITAGVAEAAWRTSGAGLAQAIAGAVEGAAAPTAVVVGDAVTLSWAELSILGALLSADRYTIVGHRLVGTELEGPFDVGAECTDVVTTSCDLIQPVGETWRYAVIASVGAWVGQPGTASDPVTVTPPPTSAVGFPSGSAVNAAGWSAACSAGAGVCGSATPDTGGAAITRVEVRLIDPQGRSLDAQGEWVSDAVWLVALDRAPAAAGEPAPIEWSLPVAASLLGPDGTYTAEVRAGDAAGWAAIEGSSGSTVVDRIAPITTSDAPSEPQPSAITVTLEATDERSGVASTEYRTATDGATFGSWTSGTSIALTTSATHTIQFRSTDVAGNVEEVRTATVTVDLTPPTVTLLAPDDATTVLSRTAVTFSASASDANFAVSSVHFEWSRDGTSWTQVGDVVTTPVASTYTTSGTLPAGTLQLRASATRAGGITGVSSTRTITVRPEVVAVELVDVNDPGVAAPGDRIVITFSDALDPASVCSTFTSGSGPYLHSDLTLSFNGNPNVVTITATGGCGTSGFGSITVGGTANGRYTQGNQTLSFAGSTIEWDPTTLQLRLTLGATRTGTATTGAAATAAYTPGALTSHGVGLPAGTVSSASPQGF